MFKISIEEGFIYLDNSIVRFINDYGLVSVNIMGDEKATFVGVVDKNYKEVLPLVSTELVSKVSIFKNGNILYLAYNGRAGYEIVHRLKDGSNIYLGMGDFLEIYGNDEVVILDYGEYNALYDTQTGEILTPFYHFIGEFIYSDKYKCRVARAIFYIECDGKIVNEVSTIINEKGEVLDNYYDLGRGEKTNYKDLTLVLNRKK